MTDDFKPCAPTPLRRWQVQKGPIDPVGSKGGPAKNLKQLLNGNANAVVASFRYGTKSRETFCGSRRRAR
jgi:hypothetical protein